MPERERLSLQAQAEDAELGSATHEWVRRTLNHRYSYRFDWLGRPIIQYPQDIAALQEIIWAVQPSLIIETGIARGGSLIFSASMLSLLDLCEAIEAGESYDPRASRRLVLGVDIDIRPHNRTAIESHPMAARIQMLEASSIDEQTVAAVSQIAADHERVLVCLDSNHTHAHVLAELEAYAPMTSVGSYCIVFDTVVEKMPVEMFTDRPWAPGNNPHTAVAEFLKGRSDFVIDTDIQHKLLVTVAPDGYLKRVS